MLESREPSYYQIKRALLSRIESGEWTPGTQLPTEQELQDRFGVSRGTVRRALDELVFEGRIRRRSGKGTFVREPPAPIQTPRIVPYSEQVRQLGLRPSTQVLSAEIIPASQTEDTVRHTFNLGSDDPVIHIRRLRLGDDQPLSLQTVYLLPELCPGILERDLTHLMPLYVSYGQAIHHADEVIRVITCDGSEARLLGLQSGAPVVSRLRVSYLADGRPFEVLYALDRTDRFELRHRLYAG